MAGLQFVFRADASRSIGSGHIMRCLSLADFLAMLGNRCLFLYRPAPGDLTDEIRQRGHAVLRMPDAPDSTATFESSDARASRCALSGLAVDWLVVDHYSLGIEWEREIAFCGGRVLVIDDVGRDHECDLLLDQNFPNTIHERYRRTLPETKLLIGPKYALLRAEFSKLRLRALQRRNGALARILVSMGGSDPSNATERALAGIKCAWKEGWQVDVAIGASNPHRESINSICERLPAARLHVQSSNMAELMTAADCAIGAGGSTTWERCCMGLPSIVSILSSDQDHIARAVAAVGAQSLLGFDQEVTADDYKREIAGLSSDRLRIMSNSAAGICDGLGAGRVAERLQ